MAGFFSRLFSRKSNEPEKVDVVVEQEPVQLYPFPINKLVKFSNSDKNWPGKMAIIISREEPTERQLRESYKKDIPFIYKVAVEQENNFLHLKIPVSHLRIVPATSEELENFKLTHTTIKIGQETGVSTTAEIVTQEEIDKWNNLLAGTPEKEEIELH
ncbi:MAG: hypothetical protein HZB65_02470 [Candidatus Aenigmarchaeota archaeon]|nr:hypothetical protein [Candidatus Aenigmarchaeota archaeon]